MNQLATLKILTNTEDKDALLLVLIDRARQEFLDYTKRIDVPAAAGSLITSMVVESFNRIGTEGFSNQEYSNISENYLDGYSANILSQLKRYRKVQFL